MNFFQPKPVVNHPDPSVDYTRVVEYKHLPTAGSSPHTVLFYERSSDVGEPYYPVPTPKNQALYERYKAMAADEADGDHVLGMAIGPRSTHCSQ